MARTLPYQRPGGISAPGLFRFHGGLDGANQAALGAGASAFGDGHGVEGVVAAGAEDAADAGQYFWTQGYRLAPAAVAAPFSYTSMLWALLFGFWIWGEVPSVAVLFGAAIVISAGFYILWRETVRGRDVVRQPQH